jgi:hypothetical protein
MFAQVFADNFALALSPWRNIILGCGIKPIAGTSLEPVTNCKISPRLKVKFWSSTSTLTLPCSMPSSNWLKLNITACSFTNAVLTTGLNTGSNVIYYFSYKLM